MQKEHKSVKDFSLTPAPNSDLEKLTHREREILALLAVGFLNKEISGQLGISENALRYHLRLIYKTLHVHSRKEASAKLLTRS